MANVIVGHVSKRFGNLKAVSELSFAIDDGEFVVLLGPSGAGKTTTLRLIAGLEHSDEGSIYIGARDVTRDPLVTRTFVRLTAERQAEFEARLRALVAEYRDDADGGPAEVAVALFALENA